MTQKYFGTEVDRQILESVSITDSVCFMDSYVVTYYFKGGSSRSCLYEAKDYTLGKVGAYAAAAKDANEALKNGYRNTSGFVMGQIEVTR